MAGHRLTQRLQALELRDADAFQGEAVWLVLEPGETTEEGMARWEAKNGPSLPGQRAIIWHPVYTGVPRGEDAWCA